MALVTLGDLVGRARKRANQENSTFRSDADVKRVLLTSVQRLRQRLHTGGQEYERLTAEMDVIPGQALYNLPSDFNQLQTLMANRTTVQVGAVVAGVWNAESSDAQAWVPLWPFELAELAELLNRTDGNADTVRYRLRGTRPSVGEVAPVVTPTRKIELRPTPRVSFTLRLDYLPTTLLDTSDTAPIEGLDGFEEIPVLEAAIYLLQEEESDTTSLDTWLKRELERLADAAPQQDRNRPERVVDVYAQQHMDTIGGGPRRGSSYGWWP
jgi:hypothetical protein